MFAQKARFGPKSKKMKILQGTVNHARGNQMEWARGKKQFCLPPGYSVNDGRNMNKKKRKYAPHKKRLYHRTTS